MAGVDSLYVCQSGLLVGDVSSMVFAVMRDTSRAIGSNPVAYITTKETNGSK